jgi:hypothetical protein
MVRREYLQSLPEANQRSFQFKVRNDCNAEYYSVFSFFNSLLGRMNGFGFDIRGLVMIGQENDIRSCIIAQWQSSMYFY